MLVDYSDTVSDASDGLIYQSECQDSESSHSIQVLLLANDMMPGNCVTASLIDDDWNVTRVEDIETMIAAAKSCAFNIIVVDLRPDLLGYQAVRQLRMAHLDLPVLFVSACSTSDALNRAFSVGADDVVIPPLHQADLKNRMLALLARAGTCKRPATVRVGRLEFDLAGRYAHVAGKPLSLNSHEYAACELLVSRNGAPVGKNALLQQAYDGDQPAKGNVDKLMSRLRSKLADAGADNLIQTFSGLGYALNCSRMRPQDHLIVITPQTLSSAKL